MKGVLFDLDGTLLDTTEYILQAIDHSMKYHGVSSIPVAIRDTIIGKGETLRKSYELLAEDLQVKADIESLCYQHDLFQRNNRDLVKLYEGVDDVLKFFKEKGTSLAVVTNRTVRASIEENLKAVGIDIYFNLIISPEDVEYPKPHPEPVLKAMSELHLLPHETCMVGDSNADIAAGKAAGVNTVGVLYGFSPQSVRESKPDYTIKSMKELESIISY